jgi:surfeit locus 1 family protein
VTDTSTNFRPPWWATLILFLLAGISIWAGIWQLERADEKRALFMAFDAGTGSNTLLELVPMIAPANRYQRISILGAYDPDHQVLIDSMMLAGKVGYQVLTPFQTNGKTVMVNRGWIPADPDRSILPDIRVDADTRKISGRLDLLPRAGLKLSSELPITAVNWPRRLLFPSADDIAGQIGYPVLDYQVLLDAPETDGYARSWRPGVMGPDRHQGYAFQWFMIAFALFVIYAVVNLRPGWRSDTNE